jgi:hypothetical protein
MRRDLKERYSEASTRSVLLTATFLDPRYKCLKFVTETERENLHLKIKDEMESVSTTDSKTEQDESDPPPAKKFKSDENDVSFSFESMIDTVTDDVKTESDSVSLELEKYIKERHDPELLKQSDFCPLEFWKSNSKSYPRLAVLSRKYLCIPATSTPSERIFSLAGNIITKKRSLLSAENVDRLIFLNKNEKYW